jgi:hypothetical protein
MGLFSFATTGVVIGYVVYLVVAFFNGQLWILTIDFFLFYFPFLADYMPARRKESLIAAMDGRHSSDSVASNAFAGTNMNPLFNTHTSYDPPVERLLSVEKGINTGNQFGLEMRDSASSQSPGPQL